MHLKKLFKFHHTRIEWCGIDAVCQPEIKAQKKGG